MLVCMYGCIDNFVYMYKLVILITHRMQLFISGHTLTKIEESYSYLFKIILLNHHQYCIKEVFTGKLGVNICDYCNRA